MIENDNELTVTQERIDYFVKLLAQLRVTTQIDEFPLVASGYRSEIERMQHEVLEYVSRHSTQASARAG